MAVELSCTSDPVSSPSQVHPCGARAGLPHAHRWNLWSLSSQSLGCSSAIYQACKLNRLGWVQHLSPLPSGLCSSCCLKWLQNSFFQTECLFQRHTAHWAKSSHACISLEIIVNTSLQTEIQLSYLPSLSWEKTALLQNSLSSCWSKQPAQSLLIF